MDNTKQYIGDAVYADFDGYSIVLTTEDGISVTNRIVLEPQVWEEACQYVDGIKARLACAVLKPESRGRSDG